MKVNKFCSIMCGLFISLGAIAQDTRPGTYDLYISVGKRDGTPTIAMPLKDDDGQRRYKIGQIILKPKEAEEE